MIKNRNFMFGLGLGLIIGALLLQLMVIGQGKSEGLRTKEEIQQAAGKLNLKVVEQDQELLTEEEWRAKSEDKDQGENAGQNASKKPLNPSHPDTPVKPDSPNQPTTEKKDQPKPPSPPDDVMIEYRVVNGTTLAGVAEGLAEAGVITDKEAFIKEGKAQKINSKIRTGTYSFKAGESYGSIITKITSRPSK